VGATADVAAHVTMAGAMDAGAMDVLRIYGDDLSFAAGVGGFLAEGCRNGQPAFAIATAPHHALLEPYRAASAGGAPWIRLDAAACLAAFMANGRPDARRFDGCMRTLQSRVPATTDFRVFGDMVAVLAHEGNLEGARQVGELWDAYGRRERRAYLCRHSADHALGGPAGLRLGCLEHWPRPAALLRARGGVDLLAEPPRHDVGDRAAAAAPMRPT
jgi:hypothetical protein